MLPASSVEKILVTPPKPAATISVPARLNSQSEMVFPYWRLDSSCPVFALQMCTLLEQDTTSRWSGLRVALLTWPPAGSSSVWTSRPVAMSQMPHVPSLLAVTTSLPSGLNHAVLVASPLGSTRTWTNLPVLTLQTRAVPSSDAVTSSWLFGLNAAQRMPEPLPPATPVTPPLAPAGSVNLRTGRSVVAFQMHAVPSASPVTTS